MSTQRDWRLPYGAYDFTIQFDSHVAAWHRARMIRQAGLEAVKKALSAASPCERT